MLLGVLILANERNDAGTFEIRWVDPTPARLRVQSRIALQWGATWKLLFTNPDAKGFFDAIAFWDSRQGIVAGDAVDGHGPADELRLRSAPCRMNAPVNTNTWTIVTIRNATMT